MLCISTSHRFQTLFKLNLQSITMFSLRRLQGKIDRDEFTKKQKKQQPKKVEIPTFVSLTSKKAAGQKRYVEVETIVDVDLQKKSGKKQRRFYNLINSPKPVEDNVPENGIKSESAKKQKNDVKNQLHLLNIKNPLNENGDISNDENRSFDLHKPLKEFKKSGKIGGDAIRKQKHEDRIKLKKLKKKESILLKKKGKSSEILPPLKSKRESTQEDRVSIEIATKKNKLNKRSTQEDRVSNEMASKRKKQNIRKISPKKQTDNVSEISRERTGVMDFDPDVSFSMEPNDQDQGEFNENVEVPYFYRATSCPQTYPEREVIIDTPYIDAKKMNNNSIVVILRPYSKLYLQGYYYIKLLVGNVVILGYKFNQGERQAIFCPPCNCILPIEALKGTILKKADKEMLLTQEIPVDWISEISKNQKDKSMVIVQIERYFSSLTLFLKETKSLQLRNDTYDRSIFSPIEVSIVKPNNSDYKNAMKTLIREPLWDVFSEKLESIYKKDSRLVIVICGGQCVGKSEFLRWLANSVLNFQDVSEVTCLDLDPGQSEFSIPGTLSSRSFSSPLLGPSFTHANKKFSYKRDIFYGEIAVQNALPEYLSIASTLMEDISANGGNNPLIVNTMGFTQNAGLDIIVDIMRIISPTHVVNIESRDTKSNFAYRPDMSFVNSCKYGITTKNSGIKVNYDTTYMPVAGDVTNAFQSYSRTKRELRINAYLSQLWKESNGRIIGDNCKPVVVIPWHKVAVHVFSTSVASSHILQVLNGSFVALCQVDEDELESLGPSLPKIIQRDSKWINDNICHGYGIVRGIEPLKREIHILTPLSDGLVTESVNVLVVPKITLPHRIFKFFSSGNSDPYLQTMKRNLEEE